MELVAFDVETSIINSGDPYHPDNRLVEVGFYNGTEYRIQYKEEINPMTIKDTIQYNILVGANLKFDLAWLERIGVDTRKVQVYDVQLAEFIISNQSKAFPSLDYMAEKYGVGHKIDNIKLNYWEKGIDTWFVPEEELTEYLKEDLGLGRLHNLPLGWTHRNSLACLFKNVQIFFSDFTFKEMSNSLLQPRDVDIFS